MGTGLHLWSSESISVDALAQGLEEIKSQGAESILILCASDTHFDVTELNPVLQSYSLPIFGGIYPAVLIENRVLSQGILIVGFPVKLEVSLYEHISVQSLAIADLTRSQIDISGDSRNYLLFVDGLSSANEKFINHLYENVGSGSQFLGGGAGYLDLEQDPCIFTNQGLLKDAAILVELPCVLHLGASHGWEILSGPYLASETLANRVISINYQPAFDVFREIVEQQSENNFDEHDFFSIAAHHPLGIMDVHGEIIVRDPISTERHQLVCVGEIPANSMLYILKGDQQTLIESAKQALKSANAQVSGPSSYSCVFDCISRKLFMGQEFTKEIDGLMEVQKPGQVLFGALSLGEIITGNNGAINWLNKSTAVGVFESEGLVE